MNSATTKLRGGPLSQREVGNKQIKAKKTKKTKLDEETIVDEVYKRILQDNFLLRQKSSPK
jgi:hypothetical protein